MDKEKSKELFFKIQDSLESKKHLKLTPEEIEYLSAILILELDKGKRLNTLSDFDKEFISSLNNAEHKSAFKKNLYNKLISNSNFDKKA